MAQPAFLQPLAPRPLGEQLINQQHNSEQPQLDLNAPATIAASPKNEPTVDEPGSTEPINAAPHSSIRFSNHASSVPNSWPRSPSSKLATSLPSTTQRPKRSEVPKFDGKQELDNYLL